MIFPKYSWDWNGDAVMEIMHISEASTEKKKALFDKKTYLNTITVNPVNQQIIKYDCDCYDFQTNKGQTEPCKHLRESMTLLNAYGIYSAKSNGSEGEMANLHSLL